MRISMITLGALTLAAAAPAFAQEPTEPRPIDTAVTDPPKAFTITGSVTATTDYRFRGLTQTNEDPAVQATVNVNHESGFYVGVFASTIDGGPDGSTPALTNYGDVEIDLYGGFTKTLDSGLGIDAGLLYYFYADNRAGVNTDFFEPYASLSYTVGPVATKIGAAYAWGGQKGLNFTTSNDDNIYIYGEASVGIPNTPITLKSHLGYSDGSLGLANPTVGDQTYWDWSLGAEAVKGPFKLGVSYVDTDVTNDFGFANALGRDATVLAYVAFSF